MNAQEKMMYKFSDALTELLKVKSLNKITVTDITQHCNVTRQIFYHYFEDKSDLIAFIYQKTLEQCIQKNSIFVWETFILSLIEGIYDKKEFYQSAVFSDKDAVLYNIFYHNTFHMYSNIIEYQTAKKIQPDIEFLLELYCRGGIDSLIKWISSGMKIPCDKLKDLFLAAMPVKIHTLLTECKIPLEYIYP